MSKKSQTENGVWSSQKKIKSIQFYNDPPKIRLVRARGLNVVDILYYEISSIILKLCDKPVYCTFASTLPLQHDNFMLEVIIIVIFLNTDKSHTRLYSTPQSIERASRNVESESMIHDPWSMTQKTVKKIEVDTRSNLL